MACDLAVLDARIIAECSVDPITGLVYLWDDPGSPCTVFDANVSYPYFYSLPDVSYEGVEIWDCSKLARRKGATVLLTLLVDQETDPSATCTPKMVAYNVTIPNF
jgi:hypothetical protein